MACYSVFPLDSPLPSPESHVSPAPAPAPVPAPAPYPTAPSGQTNGKKIFFLVLLLMVKRDTSYSNFCIIYFLIGHACIASALPFP